ncbi:MAG TPA: HAMP domain-containing sensor histidine kinase [Streptosporangiaceae bacterium]|nr:HAMP domain-containing sensor histidine kinase [Streptosporangiaceae bacterium]
MRLRGRVPAEVLHAARVAAAASLLVGIVYAGCVTVLDHVVAARLTASVDARLSEQLSDVREVGLRDSRGDDDDIDTTPVYLWKVTSSGRAVPVQAGTPALPSGLRLAAGHRTTARLGQGPFRLAAGTVDGSRLIAGQSLQSDEHLTTLLRTGEALAAPVLLLAMFAGALTIGLRALSPVEQSRRRQLEFTADASHELRTPLSVISAETSVALSSPREPAEYQATLRRIEGESGRLRKIVEDLLWLARFDSAPPDPGDEPLDLATIAGQCAGRFRAVGTTREFNIQVVASGLAPGWISAPPEWIDRLAGVLVDNACRYAGSGGTVRISIGHRGARVTLTVEDSGPGVPPESRRRLFDRFHRSTVQGGSAGLGLAIADSIVRSTDGQWRLGDSDLGGALFEVSWRRASVRHSPAASDRGARPDAPPPSAGQAAGQSAGQAAGAGSGAGSGAGAGFADEPAASAGGSSRSTVT